MRASWLLLFLALPAHAGDKAAADRLVAEGAALGEAGRYREAIAKFHAADAAFPQAINDCNVALAYIGLQSRHRAWFHLDRCQRRSTGPLPAWVAEQHQTLSTQLSAGGHGLVTVASVPSGARLSIPTLGEAVRPKTPVRFWAPLGVVEVSARAPGFAPAQRRVTVEGGQPTAIELRLQRPTKIVVTPVTPPSAPPPALPTAPASVAPAPDDGDGWAWTALTVGGLAAVGGVVAFVAALDSLDAAEEADRQQRFDDRDAAGDDVRLREGLAYGLWGVGAVGIGLGLWWVFDGDGPSARIGPDGASLGWRW